MKLAFHRSPANYLESVRATTVSGEERLRRQRLGEFLRRVEPTVHSATGVDRERLRSLLGWDDESLHAFVAADVVIHTSPHASMNAFEPAFAFPWLAARLASSPLAPSAGVHLRTPVTHNNLGDLRWRPYAWWHRSSEGAVVKTRIFSRNAKSRHDVLFSKAPPRLSSSSLGSVDREAVRLAGHAGDYAGFCLLYRSAIERHAGLHGERPLIEVPLGLLNAFTIREEGIVRWRETLAEFGMSFRATDANGSLVEVPPDAVEDAVRAGRSLLCPNAINLAQVHLLGISCMIGAEQMAKYVPETADLIDRFVERLGLGCHQPELVSLTDAPIAAALGHDAETIARLAEDGLRGSLSVGAVDIGSRVAVNLDCLVGAEHAELLRSPRTLTGAGGVA
jgi:hypothetical protein